MGRSIHPLDAILSRIASGQKGLVTYRQMLAAGVGRGAIELRVRHGGLHRVFRGVYLVGHRAMAPLAREHAAVLSYGDAALLGHRAAIGVWQMLPKLAEIVDVVVPGRHSGTQPGINVHRTRTLAHWDVTRFHDIPITTPARTLLDFAESYVDFRDLERAFSEAQARNLISPKKIEAQLARSKGRKGAKPLKALYDRATTSTKSHSELEELLLHLIREALLPQPEMNVVLLGKYKVDFLFREHNTIAEADGGGWHASQERRDRDHRRDSELRRAGYTVERFTDHELSYQPHAAVARLTRAIYA